MTDDSGIPRYSDPNIMGVFNSYSPSAGGHASQTALTDPVLDGPFGHQLVHGNPDIDIYLRNELCRNDPTATYPNYIINPGPGLAFIPSASSSGWLISGLPIETVAAIKHPSNVEKTWLRYGEYGFVELNKDLFAAICPADLSWRQCKWDETWVWDPQARKWRGGCQMIRLCERLQYDPPPGPPALTPYQYALHVDSAAHETLLALRNTPASILTLFDPSSSVQQPHLGRHLPHTADSTTMISSDPTASRPARQPLLGSIPTSDWPVLVHAPLPPRHEDHVFSCKALHGVVRTCWEVRSRVVGDPPSATTTSSTTKGSPMKGSTIPGKKQGAAEPDTGEDAKCPTRGDQCLYGHDFLAARRCSVRREKAHAHVVTDLVRRGKAVATQRVRVHHHHRDWERRKVVVWLGVHGWTGESGEIGKFVIDGDARVRGGWDLLHTLPWCRVCNPVPPEVVVGRVGGTAQVEGAVGAQYEEEEGESGHYGGSVSQVEGQQFGYEEPDGDVDGGHDHSYTGEHGHAYHDEHDHQNVHGHEHESASWTDVESPAWQTDEVEADLMTKWRAAMAAGRRAC